MEGDADDRMTARRSWAALGTSSTLRYEGAELLWVDLPFVSPVGTAVGTHRARPLVLVRLRCRTADGTEVCGWGECAALADSTYDVEDVAGAWAALEDRLVPALAALSRSAGRRVPAVGRVDSLAPSAPGRPLALAALEMAVADAHLRAAGLPFADLLGVAGAVVQPGAVLGTAASDEELLSRVDARAAEGYVRVKVKVAPGTEERIVSALARWADTATGVVPRFQVDANGAFGADDLDALVALDRYGLLCIEQPFARDDLDSHRRLAARMQTPVCLDESLDSPGRVVEAVSTGACSVVCVKPGRLGGIGPALEVIEWCGARRVPWWIGGMFESGYARGVLRCLAALPGLSLPGDLAPSLSYLDADLVPSVTGRTDPTSGVLVVEVPREPGLGPAPAEDALAAHLVRRSTLAV